ncbi:hypothetical protein L6270_00280 [Candidatus Parcubacteria bacterium]|nr:hypothetical protein [Patescibacteria group bacterium]MBU4309585.1 hypothetical protein [Patescibacteria group bacterium]MBU4432547.1 hypothetical protein [Patescibacteria group bacterium]MBU4578027.1 hypothetical protein [Patescibacteria group bacterium]MCG2696465.1 hypothetical protein [Candidatus Parcubacteria bacterium]
MKEKNLLKFNKAIYSEGAIKTTMSEFSWISKEKILLKNTPKYYEVELPVVDDVAGISNEFKNYALFLSVK